MCSLDWADTRGQIQLLYRSFHALSISTDFQRRDTETLRPSNKIKSTQRLCAPALKSRESRSSSGSGVESIVDGAEPCFEHVCIDLCRRQVRMAEHHLDGAQIRAV